MSYITVGVQGLDYELLEWEVGRPTMSGSSPRRVIRRARVGHRAGRFVRPNGLRFIRSNGTVIGYDDYNDLGSLKKKFKKIAKKVVKPIKKIHEKITPKPLLKVQKKVSAVHKKVYEKAKVIHEKHVRPILMKYVVPVAGAVLAPFTLGLSALAATAVTTGYKMYEARKNAKEAVKKAEKQQAALAQQQQQQYETEANQQLDALHTQARASHFIPLGYTDEVWARMTIDQKIALVQQMNTGTARPYSGSLPSTPPTTPSTATSSAPAPTRTYTPVSSGGGGGGGYNGAPVSTIREGEEVPVSAYQGQAAAPAQQGGSPLVPLLILAALAL